MAALPVGRPNPSRSGRARRESTVRIEGRRADGDEDKPGRGARRRVGQGWDSSWRGRACPQRTRHPVASAWSSTGGHRRATDRF
eukprot:6212866-Pleurochrysis_carterae.AAC.8